MKRVDKSSPALFVSSCDGSVFPEAHFTLRKAGESQQEYYKITLTEVLISAVAPGGSTGSGQEAFEQVSFAFAAAEISAAGPDGKFDTRRICGGTLEEEPPPVIIESVKKE
jgi:type VI secretion system secreted protein Hcp